MAICWAWATPALRGRPERQGRVRAIAARALLRAYLAHDGETRQAASNALLVVDAPGLDGWIAAARAGTGDVERASLDALAERLRRSPLR